MLSTYANQISYRHELARKLIHLSSLWMPIALYYLEPTFAALIFAALLAILLLLEYLREHAFVFSNINNALLLPMLRAHEKTTGFRLNGACYVLISACVASLCFSKIVAITALCIMLTADSAAALIGRRFGKQHRLGKSWTGSCAFSITGFLTVIIIGWFIPHPAHFYLSGFAATLTATLIELFSNKLKIDDNLSITLTAAITQSLALYLLN